MKFLIIPILVLLIVFTANAQQRPYYTQYILNNYIVNPAIAGIENYWDVKVSHRRQWVGLDGAPTTTYFTVHGPLKKSDYDRETATTVHIADGYNPRGKAYWQNYTAAPSHQGIGLTVVSDKTGPLSRLSAVGTYAYHIGLTPKTNLSAGLSIGIQQVALDIGKLDFGIISPIDPVVGQGSTKTIIHPDINAGLWLYSTDYFVGLAAQNIVPQSLNFTDTKDSTVGGKLIPHIFLSAGYKTYLTEEINFLPSILLKYSDANALSFDMNGKFQYRDFVWAGASYRYQDGFALMTGVNISSSINFGYAYDITTSMLNTVSRGTHEIVVGFLLGNGYKDLCPRRNW